jgi:DNA-binding GntR family transcriptional regulator
MMYTIGHMEGREHTVTAGQQAYEQLHQQIIEGDLEPGTLLSQLDLAERFGMSRIPVRDALRQLSAERLVTLRAKASAFVNPLTIEDLQDLYDVRDANEPVLSRLALANLEPEHIEEMERKLALLDTGISSREWLNVNNRFHEALFLQGRRPRMIEIVLRVREATQRYAGMHPQLDRVTAAAEHAMILDAARTGQGKRLEALVRAHLASGYEGMLADLRAERQASAQPRTAAARR